MFSPAEHSQVSENPFSVVCSLHPSDHLPFYDGDILSEFHVCWGKKIISNVHILYSVSFLICEQYFLYCFPGGVCCQQEPTGECLGVSWGFWSQNKH